MRKNDDHGNNMINDDFVVIGKIVASHGVRGDVRILPLTDFPERFFERKQVLLGEEKKVLNIEHARWNKNVILTKFKELSDMNAALAVKGQLLYTAMTDVMPLPEGNFYIFDIIGLDVYDTQGAYLGTVGDVLQTGSNDVYIVEKDNDKPLLIPALKTVVSEINVEAKKMVILPVAEWNE